MTCVRPFCGGFIRDPGDGIGARCSLCRHSPLPPPTREELLASGVLGYTYSGRPTQGAHDKESQGRRGRGPEYNPGGRGNSKVRSFSGPQ